MTTPTDPIMDEYFRLSLMSEIPDIYEHAKEWQRLAMRCDIEDRPARAETCRVNAKRYCEMIGGEYIRLVEGCFAELIPVDVKAYTPTATIGRMTHGIGQEVLGEVFNG